MNKKIWKDIYQSALGATSAMLLLFAIRRDPIEISWIAGLGVFLVWTFLLYRGFTMNGKKKNLKKQFIVSVVVTLVIATILSLIFNLITIDMIFTKEIFGSSVFVGSLLGIPIALLFNLKDLNNILSRYKYMAKK